MVSAGVAQVDRWAYWIAPAVAPIGRGGTLGIVNRCGQVPSRRDENDS